MLSVKSKIRLSVIFGIISWILLLITDLFLLFGVNNNLNIGFQKELSALFLDVFLVSIFLFYKIRISKVESINFIDLLWKVFVTGLLATVVSFAIRFFYLLLGESNLADNIYLINFFYHLNLGLISAFIISTLIVWKRLILYQKTKNLLIIWKIFEYSLLISILLNFIDFNPFVFNGILIALLLIGVILSVNLKWVAYLNFKQKWKSILLIILILLYLAYFFINLNSYSNNYSDFIITDILNNIFILSLFGFIFIYCIFSLLVILFNLPTSSVFEQKFEDVINFQRLSQSIQTGKNEEQVLDILLDSSSSAVFASASWIEIHSDEEKGILLKSDNLNTSDIERVKAAIRKSKVKNLLDAEIYSIDNTNKLTSNLKDIKFKSVLLIPLIVKNKQIGIMALLKDIDDGFNNEITDIIRTFASQACISIENFHLLNEALENERYKEELKIAQKVQSSLLPNTLSSNDQFEISGFSVSADEVGGDYYDTYQLNNDKFVLVMGDVSGKGTSAAFHMSQMKGIFYSLAQMDLNPEDFLGYANTALSNCLGKNSFITLSFFIVNTKEKKIEFSRAGHCPTLYYDKRKDDAFFLKTKGLGLGIIRNKEFSKYVEINNLVYSEGDLLVLYTDGITEARNEENEEFGYERLKDFLKDNARLEPKSIQANLLDTLHDFVGGKSHYDDYSALIVKFK